MGQPGLGPLGRQRLARSIVIFFLAFAASCARPGPHAPPPTPSPTPTPFPMEAVRVTKPVNVRFSTYSYDWPVGWVWIDPDETFAPTPQHVKTKVLSVTVPTGKELNADLHNAPRYQKAIEGDFEIETRIIGLPKLNSQSAGLLIFQDDKNFIRLDRYFGRGSEGVELTETADGLGRQVSSADITGSDVTLKLRRKGSRTTAFFRENDRKEWKELASANAAFAPVVLAGIAGYNTAEPFDVQFVYIKLSPVK